MPAGSNIQVTLPFEYGSLDDEDRIAVQQKTAEIRERIKRTASDLVEIGERLIDIKTRLGHGQFLLWLKAEFDWSERTARNFMEVADAFKSAKFADLPIGRSALVALASPSVPEEARQEAIALAQNGHHVTHSEAKRIIADHKEPERPSPEPVAVRAVTLEEIDRQRRSREEWQERNAGRPLEEVYAEEVEQSRRAAERIAGLLESPPTPDYALPVPAAPAPKSPTAHVPLPNQTSFLPEYDERDDPKSFSNVWLKMLDSFLLFMVSLPRRGGIVVLTKSWNLHNKRAAFLNMRRLENFFRDAADQLEKELP